MQQEPPGDDGGGGALLGIEPKGLVRLADARNQGIDLAALGEDRDAWLRLLADHPALIERPVVIADDGRAVLGRPPEDVDVLLAPRE